MNNGDTEDDFYDFNEFFELPSSMLSFCCHYNEQRRHRRCLVMSISRIGWWIVQCDYQQRLWSEQCTIVSASVCYILYVVSSYCVTPPYPLSTVHICIFTSLFPGPQHHHQHCVTVEWVALHSPQSFDVVLTCCTNSKVILAKPRIEEDQIGDALFNILFQVLIHLVPANRVSIPHP